MPELGLEERSGNSPEVRDTGCGYNRQRHGDSSPPLTLELSVTVRVNNSIRFKHKTIKYTVWSGRSISTEKFKKYLYIYI